jgi:hypothetical protein
MVVTDFTLWFAFMVVSLPFPVAPEVPRRRWRGGSSFAVWYLFRVSFLSDRYQCISRASCDQSGTFSLERKTINELTAQRRPGPVLRRSSWPSHMKAPPNAEVRAAGFDGPICC